MKINSCLVVLNLQNNNIGNKGAHVLAGSLIFNDNLISLRLNGNPIDVHGGKEFTTYIKNNVILITLELGRDDECQKELNIWLGWNRAGGLGINYQLQNLGMACKSKLVVILLVLLEIGIPQSVLWTVSTILKLQYLVEKGVPNDKKSCL